MIITHIAFAFSRIMEIIPKNSTNKGNKTGKSLKLSPFAIVTFVSMSADYWVVFLDCNNIPYISKQD